ncbi:MAG: flagellar hook-associated protein FlgK [bacterium]
MSDLMRILGIARRAMDAHQAAMSVTGNNIANVNTEGYSRQRITLASSRPSQFGTGYVGSGVEVEKIERIRSTLIDQQLMSERPSFHQHEFKSRALQFVEEIFNEPSDFGLNRNLEEFFNSFQDLANDPESTAARTVVKQKAVTLSSTFNRIHRQLNTYQQQLNQELQDGVNEVNRLTAEIAKLNERIVNAEVNGHQAPDLRDKRDTLVDQVSELVDVKTFESDSGSINVAVASRMLVADTQAEELGLAVQSDSDPGPAVIFARDDSIAQIKDGKLKGILDIRDSNVVNYISELDTLSATLTLEVNTVHAAGYNLDGITGINFFDRNSSGAADFGLSTEVMNNTNLIAASDAADEPGNNNTALALSDLQDKLTMSDSQFTFSDFYNSLISTVGSESQEASLLESSFSLTVEKLELTRESVSGVSLNEEMTVMIESQTAFTAASRLVTTIDDMTQSVLNMV